eukprot:Tamp_20441.p3 GENE.Tamp_20441~~Tamp_20441.p3  ORF type:complete len:130 (-),score=6.25 Tamp_20441:33-422(-)
MVSRLGPLFRTAGHRVRTQHAVSAFVGQKHGDVEIINYLQDTAGARNLVFNLSITHDRYGSSTHPHLSGLLSHPQDPDAPCPPPAASLPQERSTVGLVFYTGVARSRSERECVVYWGGFLRGLLKDHLF